MSSGELIFVIHDERDDAVAILKQVTTASLKDYLSVVLELMDHDTESTADRVPD